MEKIAYKLLKELYKKKKMDIDSVNKLTGYEKNDNYNPYISYLMGEKLVVLFSEGGGLDGEGGFIDGVEYLRINLRGREYVEKKRKDLLLFWLPYGITTALAIASLAVAIAALFC